MLQIRVLGPGGLKVGGAELIDIAGLKWIDVENPTKEVLDGLAKEFGLHALAIEDCLHLGQRPKLEEYPGHQFIVLQGFTCSGASVASVTLHELHLFLGHDWLISVHEKPHPALLDVVAKVDSDPALTLGRGVDFVAYLLSDGIVDANFPLMDTFNDELEDLQDRMFSNPNEKLLQQAFALKRILVQMRRVMSPQRDVIGMLSRSGVANVHDKTTLYFRDIFDHLVRLYEQIENARDMLSNTMEAYLSVVANRTNDVMKQLTIFSSIFLPLGFIVGFFGQNFTALQGPEMQWVMIAMVVLLPVGMLIYFRRRRWF